MEEEQTRAGEEHHHAADIRHRYVNFPCQLQRGPQGLLVLLDLTEPRRFNIIIIIIII